MYSAIYGNLVENGKTINDKSLEATFPPSLLPTIYCFIALHSWKPGDQITLVKCCRKIYSFCSLIASFHSISFGCASVIYFWDDVFCVSLGDLLGEALMRSTANALILANTSQRRKNWFGWFGSVCKQQQSELGTSTNTWETRKPLIIRTLKKSI